jgi:hypothetical protein
MIRDDVQSPAIILANTHVHYTPFNIHPCEILEKEITTSKTMEEMFALKSKSFMQELFPLHSESLVRSYAQKSRLEGPYSTVLQLFH